MNLLQSLIVNVLMSLLYGVVIYSFAIGIVPERFRQRFFELVPLYPRPKYAVLLYLLSGFLYTFYSSVFPRIFFLRIRFFVFVIEVDIIMGSLCVIAASQIVRFIAEQRLEAVEESFDEEMERKRRERYR
ncbi:MAG: hypothetical protein DKINENOH_01407 [bacterium]|nr:hypothetical protein [bacterium]